MTKTSFAVVSDASSVYRFVATDRDDAVRQYAAAHGCDSVEEAASVLSRTVQAFTSELHVNLLTVDELARAFASDDKVGLGDYIENLNDGSGAGITDFDEFRSEVSHVEAQQEYFDLAEEAGVEAEFEAALRPLVEQEIERVLEAIEARKADELAEAEDADNSPRVDLAVGSHDYDDGLRLTGEGTFNLNDVPSARIGVYRELEDGHAHGREATVVIPTLGRDAIGADTLRVLVEQRLDEHDEDEALASAA